MPSAKKPIIKPFAGTQPEPEMIPWAKASTEDKIERCRYFIKDMMEALGEMQKKHTKLESNFFGHRHMNDTLVGVINQFGNMMDNGPKGPKDDTRTDEERWF